MLPASSHGMPVMSASRCTNKAALQREAQLGNGGCEPAEHDAGQPRVPQTHSFEVDAREQRSEAADGDVHAGQQELGLGVG